MAGNQETTFSMRFKEDSTLAMSYNRRTLAASPILGSEFYLDRGKHSHKHGIKGKKENACTNFSYCSQHALLQGEALQPHQVRSSQPAPVTNPITVNAKEE
jgi:hypothetical protein